ncbi:MAG: serine/threonine-protein phosphatase [Lachnospiraceae bacterium]|nr:serine/threonine-protein phosphatase [Lachnospiraceae bacterium]
MGFQIEAACISHMGRIRGNNEDNFYFNGQSLMAEHESMPEPVTGVFSSSEKIAVAVFDGMGGENAGETASYAAAEAFRKICRQTKISKTGLLQMMRTLNVQVCKKAEEEKLGQIGTTATILYFYADYAYIANVGDSPAYILRNGRLKQISEKHTNEELLRLSGLKNRTPALTQFLGIAEEELYLEPYLAGVELEAGDICLLCSDGLTDMVTKENIQAILSNHMSSRHMVTTLLETALQHGGRDNITIICCRVC